MQICTDVVTLHALCGLVQLSESTTPLSLLIIQRCAAEQVEDKEGETPLSMAANHGKLRDLMVQVATGQMDVDEIL